MIGFNPRNPADRRWQAASLLIAVSLALLIALVGAFAVAAGLSFVAWAGSL